MQLNNYNPQYQTNLSSFHVTTLQLKSPTWFCSISLLFTAL